MKCFAEILGGCAGGMTGEHYVSKALLKEVGDNPVISGLFWQSPGEFQKVPVGSMTANMLCQKHNGDLSRLDSTFRDFYRALRKIDKELGGPESGPADMETPFSGNDVELWFLKVICGMVYSGNRSMKGDRKPPQPISDQWCRLVYGLDPLPDKWGLYLEKATVHGFDAFGITLGENPLNGEVKCGRFEIAGLSFQFCLGRPDHNGMLIHRPTQLVFRNGEVTRSIRLIWKHQTGERPVMWDRNGSYSGEPDWVKRQSISVATPKE